MKKLFPTQSHRWITLTLVVALVFSWSASRGLAQSTTVSLDPSSQEIAVGETTVVNIRIAEVSGLYGAEVHLTFDPALLEVVDASDEAGTQIQPGTFPSPDYVAQNQVNQSAGTIDFAVTQMPPKEAVDGTGTLASITFKGKAGGTSTIGFSEILLSTSDGEEIVSSSQNGSVTVTGTAAPTNTPTATSAPGETPTPTATLPPGTTPTATHTPVPSGSILGYHTVRSGETLYCIGRAYGVDPYAIASQNGIVNPSVIHVGKVLAIPNVPRTLPSGKVCPRQFGDDTATPTPSTCRHYHTVVSGENLYRISLRYGVSMWSIAQVNGIYNLNYIRAGQVLCIP